MNQPFAQRLRVHLSVFLMLGFMLSSFNSRVQAATLAETLPIVPTIDAGMQANLRSILANGQTRGNRAGVFAKIGDSITASGSFLVDVGCPSDPPNTFSGLGSVASYFSTTVFSTTSAWCGTSNSFTHDSRAATSGWRVGDLQSVANENRSGCTSGENQLACELRISKPSIALIMIGTNDVDGIANTDYTVATYKTRLTSVVDQTIAAGVIPVLSTIPPRLDRSTLIDEVAAVNQAIIEVAQAKNVPLWNYWRSLQELGTTNHYGMDADGIHPTAYQGGNASDMTSAGLKHGYNQRNYQALQVLAKLKTSVIDNGGADTTVTPPATTTVTPSPTPDFQLAVGSALASLHQGQSGVVAVNVTRTNGFSGAVAITATGLRNGVTVSALTIPSGSNSGSLTVSANSSAAVGGPTTMTITATSGSLSKSVTTPVTITAAPIATTPSFSLASSPASLSIVQGGTGRVNLTLSRTGGFTGSIRFTYNQLPTNARASLSPARTTGNTSVITFRIARTVTAGSYLVSINAVSGSTTRTITIPLTITPTTSPAGSFTVSRSPSSLSLQQGQSGVVTVNLTRTNGFSGAVAITATGLRNGVTVSALTIPSGSNSGSLTVSANSSAAVGGPTTMTIKGVSGSLSKTVTLPVSVTAAPIIIPQSTIQPVVTAPSVPLASTTPSAGSYAIGTPTLRDIWVNPASGNDNNSGATRTSALKTLNAAWNMIPQGTTLTGTGYRVMITPGTLNASMIPNYLENRFGTYQYPIIFQAADGPNTVTLTNDLNVYNTKYMYLINFTIAPGHDTLHFEKSDHILVRGMTLNGGNRAAHETLKVNQSQYIYVEDSDIYGADDNAIDFVAVQYGQVLHNKIHNAADWCAYAKGGSAYLRYDGNEFYDCGTGGFVAGQGAGFEYMTSPWIHYEAYGITFVNNVIHDTVGAGMGVNGGYDIFMAHNTLYRVGQRDHMIEFNYGFQGCDNDTSASVAGNCQRYQTAGGWGNTNSGELEVIPNKHVYVYNNIFLNPSGYTSPSFIQVPGGFAHPPASFNLPSTTRADDDLVIKNNVFWNGNLTSLGIEDTAHCQSDNATCNETQLRRDNRFNTLQPQLVNPAGGDYRIANNSLSSLPPVTLPSLSWSDAPSRPSVPAGYTTISVSTNRAGTSRTSVNNIGAY